MSEFEVSMLIQNNIQSLYLMRSAVWIDPPYQRVSDIWPLDKKQLLIDSILNGFDLPKLYFHALTPPRKYGKLAQKYAIIDGKQRLDAIWAFIDGKFTLSSDFEYLHDSGVKAGGLSYGDLSQRYPQLRASFDAAQLAVVIVRTDDLELIEDMFSRLNEAVPLNAPEKRNAFGGPMVPAIRQLASHRFFNEKVAFRDIRYKHRDLATKFLWIESADAIVDTKKMYLDSFVRSWATGSKTDLEAMSLLNRVEKHLDRMAEVFTDEDPLLKSLGMALLVFHFFRLADKLRCASKIRRQHFAIFDIKRTQNRLKAEIDLATASYDLLEFEKHVQSPNDAYATRLRLAIMVRFMKAQGMGLNELPKDHEYFDATP